MNTLGLKALLLNVGDVGRREGHPSVAGQFPVAVEVLGVVFLLSIHLDGHSHAVCAHRRL